MQQQSYHFKPQSIYFTQTPLLNSTLSATSLQWGPKNKKIKQSSLCLRSPNLYLSHRRRAAVVSAARKNGRRPKVRISPKSALQFATFLATNLSFFPEPVNLILKEGLGGGGGGDGNGGFGGGFGSWGGFGVGGFDGWRRPRVKKLGFFVLFCIACGLVLVLVLGKEFKGWSDLGLGAMGVAALAVLERDWKRGVKGWTLGFCSCALMVFWGFTREDLHRWGRGLGGRSAFQNFFRRSRRRRRGRAM